LAEAYAVRGVPAVIVIDDQMVIEGAIPPRRFVEAVVEASHGPESLGGRGQPRSPPRPGPGTTAGPEWPSATWVVPVVE